jgi:hypothetical protein
MVALAAAAALVTERLAGQGQAVKETTAARPLLAVFIAAVAEVVLVQLVLRVRQLQTVVLASIHTLPLLQQHQQAQVDITLAVVAVVTTQVTTHLALVALVVAGQVPEEQIVVVPQQQTQAAAAAGEDLLSQETLVDLAALEVAA